MLRRTSLVSAEETLDIAEIRLALTGSKPSDLFDENVGSSASLSWNAILSGAFESPAADTAVRRRSKARDEATEFRSGTSEQGQSPRDKSHDE